MGAGEGAGRAKSGRPLSGRSSCRPARSLLPQSVGSVVWQQLSWGRSDWFGLPRPAPCRKESLPVGPAVPPSGRPRGQTPELKGLRSWQADPGMGGEQQHYYGKHGRQPLPAPRPGPWAGAKEMPISVATPFHHLPAPLTITCQHPSPQSYSRESLRGPSKCPHSKGPFLKPSPQYSCGVSTLDSPFST